MGRPLPLDDGGARGADQMADGDGRAALTLAEEVWRAARDGETFDAGRAGRGRAAARADLRQGAGGPLQPDLGAAQDACAAPIPTRRSIISRACSTPARTRCSSPAASCAWRARTSASPIRRRSSSPTPPRTPTIFSAARRANWRSPRRSSMSRPRRNRTRSTPRFAAATGARQIDRLAAAAQGHPQRADQADARGGLRRRLRYDHDQPDAFSGQDYWPEAIGRRALYEPGRARLRARDPKAAGVVGEAAARAAGRVGGVKRGVKFAGRNVKKCQVLSRVVKRKLDGLVNDFNGLGGGRLTFDASGGRVKGERGSDGRVGRRAELFMSRR